MQLNSNERCQFIRVSRDQFKVFYTEQTRQVLTCTSFEAIFSKSGGPEHKLNVFLDENNEKKISYDRSKPLFKPHANAQAVIAVFEQWLLTNDAAAILVVGRRMVAALPVPPQAAVAPQAAAVPLPLPPAPQAAAQPELNAILGVLAQRLQSFESASEQQRQMDQEQQRQREQVLANAIRDGLENQRREREENRRAVAELAARLERTKIKPEVKPEVQDAVAAVQNVVVRVVIPDDPAPRPVFRVPDDAAPRRLIIRRRERDAAQEEETGGRSAGKRRGRDSDSDDDAPTIGDRMYSGYKAVRTLIWGKESTDKWIRKGAKKMNRDNQP
jgi:hypothetical protein